ncbi:MAG TPA: KH domain-containing protein [Bacilli bacterium]
MDYEKLVRDMVYPLVLHPEDMVVKTFSEEDEKIVLQIMVHADDLGRVIGKKGRVINAVRTIVYACGARNGKKIEISVDSF